MISRDEPSIEGPARVRRAELLEALGELWSLTGRDWVLAVSHVLTEPTCPTAWVHPEGDEGFGLFRVDASTLDEAIDATLALAHHRIVLGRPTVLATPWTPFGDEEKLVQMLQARAAQKATLDGSSPPDNTEASQ